MKDTSLLYLIQSVLNSVDSDMPISCKVLATNNLTFNAPLDADFQLTLAETVFMFSRIAQKTPKTYNGFQVKTVFELDESSEFCKFKIVIVMGKDAPYYMGTIIFTPTSNREFLVSIDCLECRNNLHLVKDVMACLTNKVKNKITELLDTNFTFHALTSSQDYNANLNLAQRSLREINSGLTIQTRVSAFDSMLTYCVVDTYADFRLVFIVRVTVDFKNKVVSIV